VRRLREHGLAVAFTALLVGALVGEAFAGRADYNDQAADAGLPVLGMLQYLTSAHFAADVAENWQSEYLQFTVFILLTVWLVQRGSPESKPLDKAGAESDEEQKVGPHATRDSPAWARLGGWRTRVYSHSLGLVMTLFFLGSWLAQFVAGALPTTPTSSRTCRRHSAGASTPSPPTSGTAPCRTGSPSSSRSRAWSC